MGTHYRITEAGGKLRVTQRNGLLWIVGLPFLAAAAYLVYLAGIIIVSHARHGTLGVPSGYLPMVALLLAIAALFAWPGARFTLRRDWVDLDRDAREVCAVTSYLLFRFRRNSALSDYRAIRAVHRLQPGHQKTGYGGRATSGSTFYAAVLESAVDPTNEVMLAHTPERDDAIALARRTSDYLGLPFTDATGQMERQTQPL